MRRHDDGVNMMCSGSFEDALRRGTDADITRDLIMLLDQLFAERFQIQARLMAHGVQFIFVVFGRSHHVARRRRSLTKAVVRESVEQYLEALAEEIASGGWVDIPYIGKIQVIREEGKGYVTAITADGDVRAPSSEDARADEGSPA